MCKCKSLPETGFALLMGQVSLLCQKSSLNPRLPYAFITAEMCAKYETEVRSHPSERKDITGL